MDIPSQKIKLMNSAIWAGCWLLCVLLWPIAKADVTIVLPTNKAPYTQVAESIEQAFKAQQRDEKIVIQQLDGYTASSETKLLISLGVDAAQNKLLGQSKTPLISSFITHSALQGLLMQGPNNSTPKHFIAGIVLDQDVSRFINLLQLSLPDIQSVAVVLGPESARLLPELEVAVTKHGWQLNAHILTAKDQPLRVLNQLYANSDVMLVLPDRAAFNQRLAKLVIALSTRHRVPVMAYSKAYTQVGALLSVYSAPDKIGQQTARLAIQYLDGKLNKKGQLLRPEGFGISVNRSVERVLKTGIKNEHTLSSELLKHESEEQLK